MQKENHWIFMENMKEVVFVRIANIIQWELIVINVYHDSIVHMKDIGMNLMSAVLAIVIISTVLEIVKKDLVVVNAVKNSRVLIVIHVQKVILDIHNVDLVNVTQMELSVIIVKRLKESVHVRKILEVIIVKSVLLDITTSLNANVSRQ